MPNVSVLVLGEYRTNCYIVCPEGSGRCVVIDPGYEPDTILGKCEELGLTVEAILLTHGHFDHVGAVRELAADTGCRVYLNPAETAMPTMLTAGKLYYTDELSDGLTFTAAGMDFSVLSTPGHTPGSVCLITDKILFSGDTLFAGSCGRTDLPGGDFDQMRSSLARLAALEEDYWVLPGHGESTTLASEKRHNPYMRQSPWS